MVTLKVRRFGNSLGVVLPKEVITRLNTQDGAPLYLTETPDGGYQLVPYDPDFQAKMESNMYLTKNMAISNDRCVQSLWSNHLLHAQPSHGSGQSTAQSQQRRDPCALLQGHGL